MPKPKKKTKHTTKTKPAATAAAKQPATVSNPKKTSTLKFPGTTW